VRYRGVPVPAQVRSLDHEAQTAEIELLAEQEALPVASPGQAVVFYLRDEVLGGGTIRTVVREAAYSSGGVGAAQ
jgi:tRNA U34 2-thiouridine synthase MnmA/TrmU